jgi:hypothetical protein
MSTSTNTNPAASATVITGAQETVAEFEAFEALAGKLAKVPKSEVDEKREGPQKRGK